MYYDNIKYYQYSFREGFCSGNGINKISCIFGSSIFDGVGGGIGNGDDGGGGGVGGGGLRRRDNRGGIGGGEDIFGNDNFDRIIGGDFNEEDEFIDEVDIMCINFFSLKNFKKLIKQNIHIIIRFFAIVILQYLLVKFFGPDEISAYSVFNKNQSNLVKGPNLIAINFVN
ncbi:hypothetical protein ACTA71_007229 [Dictyostelium dimigraforme]